MIICSGVFYASSKSVRVATKNHLTNECSIVYIEEDGFHAFNSKDNPNNMINDYAKRCAEIYNDEKAAYDELRTHFKFVTNAKI